MEEAGVADGDTWVVRRYRLAGHCSRHRQDLPFSGVNTSYYVSCTATFYDRSGSLTEAALSKNESKITMLFQPTKG